MSASAVAFPEREIPQEEARAEAAAASGDVAPSAEVKAASTEVFDADYCKSLYDALGAVEAVVFGRFLRIPAPIARQLFTYSEADKTLLAPATARVLQKYAPQFVEQYAEEIGLAFLFGTIFYAKVQAALAYKTAQVAQAPANGVTGEAAAPGAQAGHGANGAAANLSPAA